MSKVADGVSLTLGEVETLTRRVLLDCGED